MNMGGTRRGRTTGTSLLDYSRNAGGDGYPYPIASGLNCNGPSYGWVAPHNDDAGTRVKVRIKDSAKTPVTGYSPNFTIKGKTTPQTPSPGRGAGEIWTVGGTKKIEWKTTG